MEAIGSKASAVPDGDLKDFINEQSGVTKSAAGLFMNNSRRLARVGFAAVAWLPPVSDRGRRGSPLVDHHDVVVQKVSKNNSPAAARPDRQLAEGAKIS